jgi:phosphohistidine phosphatase SixA
MLVGVVLLLVRHAKAGSRKDWDGDDRLRPLSIPGVAQATALVDQLAPYGVTRVLSSPYLRCTQTVAPLGEAAGAEVEPVDQLGEGRPGKALTLLRSLMGGPSVALCTHGDIIPSVLEALAAEDGTRYASSLRWSKGSTWVLYTKHGRVVRGEYLGPPA